MFMDHVSVLVPLGLPTITEMLCCPDGRDIWGKVTLIRLPLILSFTMPAFSQGKECLCDVDTLVEHGKARDDGIRMRFNFKGKIENFATRNGFGLQRGKI